MTDQPIATGRFPRGPQAYQERYIAAFEALTEILVGHVPMSSSRDSYVQTWEEMFDYLIRDMEAEDTDA